MRSGPLILRRWIGVPAGLVGLIRFRQRQMAAVAYVIVLLQDLAGVGIDEEGLALRRIQVMVGHGDFPDQSVNVGAVFFNGQDDELVLGRHVRIRDGGVPRGCPHGGFCRKARLGIDIHFREEAGAGRKQATLARDGKAELGAQNVQLVEHLLIADQPHLAASYNGRSLKDLGIDAEYVLVGVNERIRLGLDFGFARQTQRGAERKVEGVGVDDPGRGAVDFVDVSIELFAAVLQ